MTTFDDRERAFEQMFVHDEEMRFKALARRNKMVGIWAAGQLGLQPDEAEAYVRRAVDAVLEPDGDQRILQRITSDLAALSSYWTESRLRSVIAEFMLKAVIEVRVEPG